MAKWLIKSYTLDSQLYKKNAAQCVVFNAARPIPGSQTFTDDFHHGSFYSIIVQGDKNAERYVQECKNLDGWLVLFKSEEEIRKWAQEWFLLEEGYALPDDFDYTDMFQSFTNKTWGKERTLVLQSGVFYIE